MKFKPAAFIRRGNPSPLLLRITAFCWLMAKLIGWRMFTTYRLFPTAPVTRYLDNIPSSFHTFLYGMAMALLLVIIVVPKNKIFITTLLAIDIISCLLDFNRVQPWDYQYLFILFIFITNWKNEEKAISLFALVMVSTYIYGGLGKLNEGFLHTIWSKMLLQQFLGIGQQNAIRASIQSLGYCVGIFEVMAGAGLLFLKTRRLSAALLIAMHLFILTFLGPLGLNYNMVVWPWNVAMIAFLFLVFIRPNILGFNSSNLFRGWATLVTICWAILPAFNFVGLWDDYLSSAMYSGKAHELVICVKDTSQCRPLRRYFMANQSPFCNGMAFINLQYWAMSETKMAPYPEKRSYHVIAGKLMQQYPNAGFSFVYFDEHERK